MRKKATQTNQFWFEQTDIDAEDDYDTDDRVDFEEFYL
jgi:hypothetical protein